jgi:hypothetical protein
VSPCRQPHLAQLELRQRSVGLRSGDADFKFGEESWLGNLHLLRQVSDAALGCFDLPSSNCTQASAQPRELHTAKSFASVATRANTAQGDLKKTTAAYIAAFVISSSSSVALGYPQAWPPNLKLMG